MTNLPSDSSLTPAKYQNPLVLQRADPWVYKHTDGWYYFTGTVPDFDLIELRRARTIQDIGRAEPLAIWHRHQEGEMSAKIWAPEIHFIAGKWYIYFAAGRINASFAHRTYVLENEAANPLEGRWEERGKVVMNWESFTLDATSFEHHGIRYLVWAQHDPSIPGNSNLYIAEMENPWTIRGRQVMISKPEYEWEKVGYLVNEGPAVMIRNGRVFLTYSASATDHHYCMGLLSAPVDSNLLDAGSWTKSSFPVFRTSEETGQYGPGHNCFTVSEDGTRDVMVYHARNHKELQGSSLQDPNRHARAQAIDWTIGGWPDFGQPVADTPE
ncbi:glycoside hydrolase family 43 protein [Paenibacillus puerhi]|uniref:glycoside hydrolase family 43 protein n=1 Tax=Paenibacillus puerhi TaxID=2692622 RepID=UPI00135AA554|nr:glycoside hydrolase family 43 protein [Paenibacillus puerhi]